MKMELVCPHKDPETRRSFFKNLELLKPVSPVILNLLMLFQHSELMILYLNYHLAISFPLSKLVDMPSLPLNFVFPLASLKPLLHAICYNF